MCPLKKPLIFAHEVELIEIEYFISMLTYTGFGPKCVYQSRLLLWFNHAKRIVVTYNCNIHAFKIISMACTTTKYMIHSLHTLSPCICIGRTLILYYYGLHNNWVSHNAIYEYYWRVFLWIMLLYLWMVLMEPALCNLLIFSPTIMSTMREDPVNTFMYLHTYVVLFHSLVQQ